MAQYSREEYEHWMLVLHDCGFQLDAKVLMDEDEARLVACNALIAYEHLQEPASPFKVLLFEHERTVAVARGITGEAVNTDGRPM